MAKKTDKQRVMIAVFTIEDGRINLKRTTRRFPGEDFGACVELLQKDLDEERDKLANKVSGNTIARGLLPGNLPRGE